MREIVLAVDPSVACTGAALFVDGVLHACGIVPTKSDEPLELRVRRVACAFPSAPEARRPDVLVIEYPQAYRRERGSKGEDPNDLIAVGCVAGAILATVRALQFHLIYPASWKGQVPKDIHNERVRKRLAPDELRTLEAIRPAGKAHNAIDAIGIGLWYLGRLPGPSASPRPRPGGYAVPGPA